MRLWTAPEPAGGRAGERQEEALVSLIESELVRAGLDRSTIRRDEPVALPGAYNPAPRRWDLVVVEDGIPVAAVGFRAATGPSFGNNFNNRVEQILGDAVNLGRPYEPEALTGFKPCLALCFVLEDCESSAGPIQTRRGHFADDFGFPEGASYKDRYGIFFERLVQDGRYDAICYLASTPSDQPSVSEPRDEMGFGRFAQSIADRVVEIRKLREDSALDPVEFGRELAKRDDLGKVILGITSTPRGLSAAEAAVIEHRRQLVARLRELALADHVTETKMHNALGTSYWVFGGQYVGIAARRTLMPLDQYDIPLVCADRSLHIVELKGPDCKVVRKHRNHLIVADEVHEAVSQCINYLRSLDDMGTTLQTVHHNELGLDYDYRRAKGTVVIGHQDRACPAGVTREQVNQTLRSYNAHLSRVQVLTYDDLLDSAERALNFEVSETRPS
ncbi:hypothetical protein GCM10022243_59950 [Saccharothrix violaceirubra]